MKNKSTDLIMTLLIVVLVLGFYFVLSDIQKVKNDTRALQENLTSLYEKTVGDTVTPGNKTATSTDEQNKDNQESVSIPTAIIFQTQSSPLLEPQTNLTVTLDSVERLEDGTVNLDIKVYTNEASSFSAAQPNNLFEMINLSGENQKPLRVQGNFDSMPPESKIQGTVTFKVDSGQEEIILQVQTTEGLTHYRFNFENESYEEAILG